MLNQLLPYVPHTVLTDLLATSRITDNQFEAAVLVIHISGLGDWVDRQQQAETITSALDPFFNQIIHICHTNGGVVPHFDTAEIIAFFPRQYRERHTTPVKRAIQAGLRLKRALRKFQAGITVRAGVSTGKIETIVVQHETIPSQLVITGTPVDEAYQAVRWAEGGQLVALRSALENVPGVETGTSQNGTVPVQRLHRTVRKKPLTYPELKALTPFSESLTRFTPPPRENKIDKVTLLRLSLGGFTAAKPSLPFRSTIDQILSKTRQLTLNVQHLSVHTGQVELTCWSTEAVPELVSLASDWVNQLRDIPEVRAVVHTCRSFVGTYGSERRKTFGVAGSGLNWVRDEISTLGNRVVRVSPEVVEATQYRFLFDDTNQLEQDFHRLQQAAKVARQQDQYETAIAYYQQILSIATYQPDAMETLAQVYFALAQLYHEIGDWTQSLVHWDCGLEVVRQLDDQKQEAIALRHQGVTYQYMGDFEAAGLDFDASLEIAMANEDPLEQAKTFSCMGRWHAEQGNMETAEALFMEAQELLESTENKEDRFRFLENRGRYHYLSGDLDAALQDYQHCLDIMREDELLSQWQVHGAMAQIYTQQEQLDRAVEHYRLASEALDRVWGSLSEAHQRAFFEDETRRAIYENYLKLLDQLGQHQQKKQVLEALGPFRF
ncbi:MAG: hypothetical protein D6675_07550 [Gemmatimonadetes bacterium]|nr:MAG: hypothetical protein D6675_07550 [Gemmatimonadota bacterium]